MAPDLRPRVSLLFPCAAPYPFQASTGAPVQPGFFHDLNLDQVSKALAGGQPEHDFARAFYGPVQSSEVARYRQDVLRDLEDAALAPQARRFVGQMKSVRGVLGSMERLDSPHYRHGWFLDAAETYCDAVTVLASALASALAAAKASSAGVRAMSEHLGDYVASPQFSALSGGVAHLRKLLGSVRYTTHISGGHVTVDRYNGEADYSAEIEALFAKFRQGAANDYRTAFRESRDANHVQAQILDQLARLYPDIFRELASYCAQQAGFLDDTVAVLDQEARFYLAYLDMVDKLRATGLPFCYPEVTDEPGKTSVEAAFDIALALVASEHGSQVVCNDVDLADQERIAVVGGPNQGGKTTFARMVGQLHYLASLGLAVPGQRAQLNLPDKIFTHFEKEERLDDLHGKLEDELVRVRDILAEAGPRSLIVMNESFSSTSLADNRLIGTRVLGEVTKTGALCVYVTFVDELSRLNSSVASFVSEVLPEDPSKRTFKVLRRPADGRAYALNIAQKYGLTYEVLRDRLGRP